MSNLFTVAGTSRKAGKLKFRVANGTAAQRTKLLEKDGQTDINLVDLPRPMTKEDAMAHLNWVETDIKTEKVAKPAKAPKAKAVKAPKVKAPAKTKAAKPVVKVEKPAATESAPSAREQNVAAVARVKAKNLETMRAVTRRLNALRSL